MGEQDDRTDFRPRIGKRQRARDRVGTSPLRIAMLVRRGHGRLGSAARQAKRLPPSSGFGPRHNARRVVVKAHVQRLTVQGAQAAARHLRYIQRDGVEKDGSPGMLYGPEGPLARERFEQPRIGEQHQFRFIVSPEDGHDLELTGYVRELMRRVERDLGRPIEWAAVNHHDTDHPHAHIVVRGVDLEGRSLRMQRAYIARGFRWTAQGLATELLGPRLELEMRRTWEREVAQERFTSLDRELERVAEDCRVDAHAILPRQGGPDRNVLVRRIDQLHHLGLAEPVTEGAWVLAEGWQAELRGRGERGDILKQVHRTMVGADPERLHVVRPGQGLSDGLGRIEERELVGRVMRVGLANELKGTFYVLLETPAGDVFHVPVGAPLVDTLRPDDVVSVRSRREPVVLPVDRHIASVAARQGGLYELAGAAGPPDDRRAAARLRVLERLGLAVARGARQWSVRADLLEELERRGHREPCRYRLSIERQPDSLDAQVSRPGPVWLDTVDRASLAERGFGGDLRAAVERRREFVRNLGLDPDDPKRPAQLGDLERRAVGKQLAQQTGQRFLETIPPHFRGRVEATPQHERYVAVGDGMRFVLVPAAEQTRALGGKTVEVTRDAQGRFVGFRSLDRDLGR